MTISYLTLLFMVAQPYSQPQPYPAQQPYYYPPPPPPPPPPAPFVSPTRGFESAAYIGFGTVFGTYGDGLDPGLRLGGIVGRRLGARFSLGLGIDGDWFSPKNSKISQYGLGLALVPSYHLPFSKGEFIFSPRIGVFAVRKSEDATGPSFTQTATGYSFGGSVTVAFALKSFRLGPMLTVEHQSLSRICESELGMERCHDPGDLDGSSGNVMSLVAAARF
jgi:hypothetical protein